MIHFVHCVLFFINYNNVEVYVTKKLVQLCDFLRLI